MRVYSVAEQDHLGADCLGFIIFLESSGVLPSPMREIVIDPAPCGCRRGNSRSDDLKNQSSLMVLTGVSARNPTRSSSDELCDDTLERVAH